MCIRCFESARCAKAMILSRLELVWQLVSSKPRISLSELNYCTQSLSAVGHVFGVYIELGLLNISLHSVAERLFKVTLNILIHISE